MLLDTLTIVGVGLIGGSIGLAARRHGVAGRIIGVGRDVDRLEQARTLGAIDEFQRDLDQAGSADLVVFCTPVDRIARQIAEAAACCGRDTILTDAGSTKASIVEAVDRLLPPPGRFVGGHPLAGSEKKGFEHASADLFSGRWTILTPTENTQASALEMVSAFWQALRARVQFMTPEEHDRALALTSHLPHLLAAALAGLLPDAWHNLTASGFRDTTRVAAGDPEIWTPIFLHNRRAALDALARLEERLQVFRLALTEGQATPIDSFLAAGKKVRDALGS